MTDHNARVLDQFDRQAEAYAALVNTAVPAPLDPFIEALRPGAGDRVLYVGCGSGQFAVAIAPRVAWVTGVDLTAAMLDQARAHQVCRTQRLRSTGRCRGRDRGMRRDAPSVHCYM